MLNANDLLRMRTDMADLMPDIGTILAEQRTPDGAGGFTSTYVAVTGGTVACRIDPMTSSNAQKIIAQREGYLIEYQLTVPYNAPIDINCQFQCNGVTHNIVDKDPEKSWTLCRRGFLGRIA